MVADLIGVGPVSQQHAAHVFQVAGIVDPAGLETPDEMARFTCVNAQLDQAGMIISYTLRPDCLWCVAAAAVWSGKRSCIPALDAVLSALGKREGRTRVGFQTARRGLVRAAQRLGFVVTGQVGHGWSMEKVIP